MRKVKNNSSEKVFSISEILSLIFIVILSSLAGIIILLDSSRPTHYEWLPILPISFGIINIFAFKVYHNIFKKGAYIIVIFLYLVRNVITPLIMRFGDYYGFFKIINVENVNKAIMLMIYETISVFILLRLLNCKNIKMCKLKLKSKIATKLQIKLFSLMIITLTAVCIFAYIRVPEIKLNYTTIFESSKAVGALGAYELLPSGSINRILYTLFNFCFNIIQLFISVWLIYNTRKVIGTNMISLLTSLLVVFCQFLFMTGENAYTFIIAFILITIIYKLYDNQRKKLNIIIGLSGLILLVIIYIAKTNTVTTGSILSDLSQMFQAYFPGVCNMAGVFNINNSSKLSTLFYDFYYMIPFRETLFALSGERLVTVYTIQNVAPAQIIPCIGQAYNYLGFIFAPAVPCFFIYIAVKNQDMLTYQNNIWKYATYTLLCLFAAVTPVMYNATIFGLRFFGTILPMMIISSYSKDESV